MESGTSREEHIPSAARILLVDDDTEYQSCVAAALREAGFSVGLACSGAEAIERLGQGSYDLVVLDVLLADAFGPQLMPDLIGRAPQTKIIFLTGYASVRVAFEALKAGACDYLLKPVDLENLIERIREAMAEGETGATY
jgi:DNA-binding NtrC family response regulator